MICLNPSENGGGSYFMCFMEYTLQKELFTIITPWCFVKKSTFSWKSLLLEDVCSNSLGIVAETSTPSPAFAPISGPALVGTFAVIPRSNFAFTSVSSPTLKLVPLLDLSMIFFVYSATFFISVQSSLKLQDDLSVDIKDDFGRITI